GRGEGWGEAGGAGGRGVGEVGGGQGIDPPLEPDVLLELRWHEPLEQWSHGPVTEHDEMRVRPPPSELDERFEHVFEPVSRIEAADKKDVPLAREIWKRLGIRAEEGRVDTVRDHLEFEL